MKTLSREQSELIEALVAEAGADFQDITPGLLEKDIHLTEALRSIFSLEIENLTPVFCGGTSLSKAYRIINRMSEDADIKLLPSDEFSRLTKSQQHKQLSQLKNQLSLALSDAGFAISSMSAQNENRYIRIDLEYKRVYESALGLRPHVQIELITKSTLLSAKVCEVNSLTNQLIQKEEGTFQVRTQNLAETLVEKVVSFLRRYAQHQAGQLRHDWDTALVRHIYDCHQIAQFNPDCLDQAKGIAIHLLGEETKEWGSQFPPFAQDPSEILLSALQHAKTNAQIQGEYQKNLVPLIYSNVKPAFSEALTQFEVITNALLRQSPPGPKQR